MIIEMNRVCYYCNKRVIMQRREDESTVRIYCPICKREDEIIMKRKA